eukprot:10248490-Karenia_brevis.AAC.1
MASWFGLGEVVDAKGWGLGSPMCGMMNSKGWIRSPAENVLNSAWRPCAWAGHGPSSFATK